MCDIRHEYDMAYMQRSEDKLLCWLLPFTCLSQGFLFTAACGRITFCLPSLHRSAWITDAQLALCGFWESELRSSDLQGLLYLLSHISCPVMISPLTSLSRKSTVLSLRLYRSLSRRLSSILRQLVSLLLQFKNHHHHQQQQQQKQQQNQKQMESYERM